MMLNVANQKNTWFKSSLDSAHIPIGLLVSIIIFFEVIIVIGGWKYKPELSNKMSLFQIFLTHTLLVMFYILNTYIFFNYQEWFY